MINYEGYLLSRGNICFIKNPNPWLEWAAAFQRGRVASADMRRTGRPRTVRTDVARAVIAQCLEDDRR